VRQDGKPERKVHSLTDAGRAELTDWLSSPVEEDLPKEPFLARLFFAALIGREGVERMLDEWERRMNEALTTLSSITIRSDDLMGLLQTATLRNGLVHAEAEREWLRETRQPARTRRADRELSGVTVTRKSLTSTYPAEHSPRSEERMMDTATPPLAVDARHLVKRHRSKTAVDGIDLQLRAGETFGLLGTNGAGKTTTVEMLAGLRRPTQGSVRVLGLNPFIDLMRFLILGILLDGSLSLYDMRKQFAAGISLFYTASFGNIQRALGQLESHGWVTILDADDSRRSKKLYVVNDTGQQAWREWMHAPVTASDAEPTMLAKVYLLGRLPAADRRAYVRRGAAREDRGGCRSARLVGSGTRCYRGLGRRPAGLPLPAGDPGPRYPCACARNAVARREETA